MFNLTRKPPEKCGECDRLRSEFNALRAELQEVQDKVYHWMKRHEARARASAAPPEESEGKPDAVTPGPNLSPRAAALLARRSMRGSNGTATHAPAG